MTIERERVKGGVGRYVMNRLNYNNVFPQKETGLSLEDELLRQRWARIREIEGMGYRAYGKRYDFTHAIPQILAEYSPRQRTIERMRQLAPTNGFGGKPAGL